MSIIVQNSLKRKFTMMEKRCAIYALDGTYLGMFDPNIPGENIDLESEPTIEELRRRLVESDGKGRKIADILRDLEAQG